MTPDRVIPRSRDEGSRIDLWLSAPTQSEIPRCAPNDTWGLSNASATSQKGLAKRSTLLTVHAPRPQFSTRVRNTPGPGLTYADRNNSAPRLGIAGLGLWVSSEWGQGRIESE